MSIVNFNIQPDGCVIAHHALGTSMAFGRVSITEILRGLRRWGDGALIQNALPMISADCRDFILTGLTPEMRDELLPEE